MKYLVMESRPGCAILLDEEGRFLKAVNPGYRVGQRVENPRFLEEKTRLKKRRWIISGAAAAAAACFIAVFGINYYSDYMSTYSTIYMNINPSVSIDLNHGGKVVGLDGENEDGDVLIEGYDYRGKEKTEVADELVDRAIDMGFLYEGGTVSFSIDSPEEALFREYGIELRSEVSHHLENVMSVNIEVVKYSDVTENEPEPETQPEPEPQQEEPQTQAQSQPQPQTQTKPQTQTQTKPTAPATPQPSGDSGYGNSGYTSQGNSGYDDPGNSGYGNSGYSSQGDSGYDSDD